MGVLLGLLFLAIVLAVVTVVGHGLWMMLAALFGSAPRQAPSRSRESSVFKSEVSEIRDTLVQINRLHDYGAIDLEQRRKLTDVLREELKRRIQQREEANRPRPSQAERAPQKPSTAPMELKWEEEETAATLRARLKPAGAQESQRRLAPSVEPSLPAASGAESSDAAPARPMTELLRGFMERRNIRWGELVSGLLIVGSSIGLVVSLWATLRDAIPYFPALLFLLGTAAIHGAGMYTLRRWRLRSTSRGLLVISTLLIPLNFLAAIALSEQRPVTDALYLASIAVGTLAFGAMAWSAGRMLISGGGRFVPIAILGTSTGQLLIARHASPGLSVQGLALLILLPLTAYLAAVVWGLASLLRRRLTARRVGQAFLLLGIAAFSLTAPIGLIVWKTGGVRHVLAGLSPELSLALFPVLAFGLYVHRSLKLPELESLRTAATSLAVLAAGLLVALVALAWPTPALLIAVGVVNFTALVLLATLGRSPFLHIPAAASLTLAILVGYHLLVGTLTGSPTSRELIEVLLMGRSGVMLTIVAAMIGATSIVFHRISRRDDARAFLQSAAGVAAAGVIAAAWSGFVSGVDAALATPVFAVVAVAVLGANFVVNRAVAAWFGSALLLLTFVHGLLLNPVVIQQLSDWRISPAEPLLFALLFALLLHATIAGLIGVFTSRRPDVESNNEAVATRWRGVGAPLTLSALITSALALPALVYVQESNFAALAGYGFWASAVWFACAWRRRSPGLLAAGQAAATISIAFSVTALCQRSDWWSGAALDPRYVQAQICGLAAWAMLWCVIRRATPVRLSHVLLAGRGVTVDRVALAAAGVVLAVLTAWGAVAGVAAEYGASATVEINLVFLRVLTAAVVAVAIGALTALARAASPGRTAPALLAFGAVGAAVALPGWGAASAQFWELVDASSLHVFGPGAWIALGLVVAALVVALWERFSRPLLWVLFATALVVPLLIAGEFAADRAAASALRWTLALFVAAAAVFFAFRPRWADLLARNWGTDAEREPMRSIDDVRSGVFAATVAPLAALTLQYIVQIALGRIPFGPVDGTFFDRIPLAASYAGPLVLIAAMFAVFAWRERSPRFALSCSLFLTLATSVACLTWRWSEQLPFGRPAVVQFIHWNALMLAGASAVWLAARRRIETRPQSAEPSGSLLVQLALSGAVALAPAVWATLLIVQSPGSVSLLLQVLGGWPGYAAIVVAAVVAAEFLRKWRPEALPPLFAGAWTAATGLAAASGAAIEGGDAWLPYRILMGGWSVLAVVLTAVACEASRRARTRPRANVVIGSSVAWASLVGAVAVVLAVRGLPLDPARPWPAAGVAVVIALCAAALGVRGRRQGFAYTSVALAVLATLCVWLRPWLYAGSAPTPEMRLALFEACLTTMSTAGLFWLLVEVVWQRRAGDVFDADWALPPVHHTVAGLGLLVVGGMALLDLIGSTSGSGLIPDVSDPGGWAAFSALAVLMFGSLWDRTARHALPGLYASLVVTIVLVLDQALLSPRELLPGVAVSGAGLVALGGLMWSLRGTIEAFARRVGVPQPDELVRQTSRWLPEISLCIAGVVALLALRVVLTYPVTWQRFVAVLAVAATSAGVAAFAQDRRRDVFQFVTLMLAAAAAVDFGWAVMPVEQPEWFQLQRAVRLLVVLGTTTAIYGIALSRVLPAENSWFLSMRRAATTTCGAALIVLPVVLGLEARWFDPVEGAPVTWMQIGVVAAVLVGLAAALVTFAVTPGRDPLGLEERGRRGYVYAAEVVLSLTFLHLYLTLPELFRGHLREYWPFVLMAIAFGGASLGELLRRKNLTVLAEPLQRTAAFMPVLPAIGFWIYTVGDGHSFSYSMVLFAAGLLYVVLAMWRQSFVYSVLAALAGNAALCSLWWEQGWELFAHPQLWLIPPALSVLAAAQLNRDRLSELQLTGIRYMAVMVIYVSSTGEMFLQGVADSLWAPMVLTGLSVLGVLAGILLRVRAFLYLGSSFLLLSIVSMVWHAAQNIGHVWPWWAFGILLGILILIVFGVFEKKRVQMLGMLDEFRQWES